MSLRPHTTPHALEKMNASSPPRALGLFLRAIYSHKRIFLEAIAATIVINAIGLATSLYSMQVYDRVIPNNGLQTLWVLTFGVLLAMIFELSLKQVRALMVDRACKAIDLDLSDHFFGRALAIRMDRRPRSIGSFAAQIRLFETVRTFLTSTTLFMLADIPFAFMFVGVIAMISGPVALVPLLLLPVSIVTGLLFIRPISRLTNQNVLESTLKNGLLIESIDGIETIKALAGEKSFLARWHNLTVQMGDGELELKYMSGMSTNLTQIIQQLSYVGMVAAGVYAITSGNLTMHSRGWTASFSLLRMARWKTVCPCFRKPATWRCALRMCTLPTNPSMKHYRSRPCRYDPASALQSSDPSAPGNRPCSSCSLVFTRRP